MYNNDSNIVLIMSVLVAILSLQVYFLCTRTEGITLRVLDMETKIKDINLRADILESIQSRLQTLGQKLNELENSHKNEEDDRKKNVQTVSTMRSTYTLTECETDKASESVAHDDKLLQNIDKLEQDLLDFKKVVTRTANELNQTVQQIHSNLKYDIDSQSTKTALEIETLRVNIASKLHSSRDKHASFSARLTDTLSCKGPNYILKFNDVIHNEENGYSSSDGKFTATEDGVYLFLFTVETGCNLFLHHTPSLVDLVVDDVFKASAIATPTPTVGHSFTTGSNAVITYVTTGQKVWIHIPAHVKNECIDIKPYRTTFTGVLLYH